MHKLPNEFMWLLICFGVITVGFLFDFLPAVLENWNTSKIVFTECSDDCIKEISVTMTECWEGDPCWEEQKLDECISRGGDLQIKIYDGDKLISEKTCDRE